MEANDSGGLSRENKCVVALCRDLGNFKKIKDELNGWRIGDRGSGV